MKPKLILCLALVLSGGLFGCVTKPDQDGKLIGRWTVEGTGDVVTLAKGNSASLKSGVKIITGSYLMQTQDVLLLMLHDDSSPSEQRYIYHISPDAWSSRILQRLYIDPNSSRIIHQ